MSLNELLPFTRSEALQAGISGFRLAGPTYHRLLHGVYVASQVAVTPRISALAALRVSQPAAWVSHHTAARLWGAWVPECTDLHVTAPMPDRRSVRRGVYTHRARLGSSPTKRYGVAVSRPLDVFFDLAALHIDLVDLVSAGDSLVRATSTEPDHFVAAAAGWSGRGARFARHAAAYVRAGVDSVQESRVRMLLVLAGLPEPVVNRITRLPNGEWQWRFDLSYPRYKILIEYDGEQHLEDSQTKIDEARRRAIRAAGWIVVVITKNDLHRDPLRVLVQVRDALRERDCADLRRAFTSTWQRHFPVRMMAA